MDTRQIRKSCDLITDGYVTYETLHLKVRLEQERQFGRIAVWKRGVTVTESDYRHFLLHFYRDQLEWAAGRTSCGCEPNYLGKERLCEKCSELRRLAEWLSVLDSQD